MWVVVVVIAGLLVVGGLLTWMILYFRRTGNAETERVLGLLRQELPRRGWTYAEQDDRFNEAFDEVERFPPLTPMLVGYERRPRALRSHDVVSGYHRGRPFLAARFFISDPPDSRDGGGWAYHHALWIRLPAPRPTLDVRKVLRMASAVNNTIGRGDVKTGHPEFDARYEVTCEDPNFARAVLTPQVIELLMREPRNCRGFWIRGPQFELLDDAFDHRDPEALLSALDLRNDFLDRIPPQAFA